MAKGWAKCLSEFFVVQDLRLDLLYFWRVDATQSARLQHSSTFNQSVYYFVKGFRQLRRESLTSKSRLRSSSRGESTNTNLHQTEEEIYRVGQKSKLLYFGL